MDRLDQLRAIADLAGPGYSELKWVNGEKKYFPKKQGENLVPITDEVIRAHLDGTQPIGINMNVGDGKSHFAVFDFDDHAGTHDTSTVLKRVGFVAAALTQMNIPFFVVRSGGGKGFHIWIAFEHAPRADEIRKRMRDVLDRANSILRDSPWPHEKFVPDDGQGKGMFHKTAKIARKSRNAKHADLMHEEHHIELLPKDGKFPVIALPLAMQSVVLTCMSVDDTGAMQFQEGGDIVLKLAKRAKPGPKGERRRKEVDVDAALEAFMRTKPGGGYKQWTDAGFNICGAFGEDGLDLFMRYSKETDGFTSERDVIAKWDDIAKVCKCPPQAFWAYAISGGYTGGLPDDINMTKSDVSKEVLTDVVNSLRLFRDGDGTAYAMTNARRAMRIDGIDFGDWLRRVAFEARVVASAEQVKATQALARAHAHEVVDVHLRVAKSGNAIYVDLCDDEDRVLKISADGLTYIAGDEPCPVMFRRSKQHRIEWADGTLDDVRACLNIDDDQFAIFMACAVKSFFPDTPSPIVNIVGPYGAGKTSATRVMRTMIDPVAAMVAPFSGKPDDLIIRAWHNYVLTLENMSDLTKLSDTLCGVTTGMGFEVRQLFTDGDLFTIYVRRPIIVNGIDPTKYAADLISRMVEIELSRPEHRMLESEFEDLLCTNAPKMFGAITKLVVETLRLMPDIDPHEFGEDIRLAEFAHVGEAVCRAMGREDGWFVGRLAEMQADAQIEAADDSALKQAFDAWDPVAVSGPWWGTPQELLGVLRKAAEQADIDTHRLPITAATLGRELNQIKDRLEKDGWVIAKRSRKFEISRTYADPDGA